MLKAVKQLPNLRHINLQNHNTSIEKVASCCPKLQSISITNNIGTKAIEKIEKLKNLDSIELHEAFMLDSTILNFKNVFSNIQYLFFTAKCTSTGLQMLLSYAYPNMKTVSLCLSHFNHTVNLTSVIKSFPNTTQIHLQEVKIVTDKLINVHSNASLLDLSGSHLCDSDLSTIAISFPNLTYLNLQNTNISDRGLSDLASCCPTPIEILTYGSDYITSDWCMHIQNRYPHIYFSDLE